MKLLSGAFQDMRNWWLPIFGGLAAISFLTWPALPNLSTHLTGDGGDTYQYAGFQQLVAINLQQGHWPFAATTAWRYPPGIDFFRAQDGTMPNLTGGLLLLATNQPTLSYNLTIFGLLLANFLASYFLLKDLTQSKAIGLVGGVGIGLSFYNLARAAGHLNLLGTGGFSLLLLALVRLWKKITWPNVALLGLSLAWLTLSSFQYIAITAIVLAVLAPIWFITTGRPAITWLLSWRHHLGKVFVMAGTVAIVTAPFLVPVLQAFMSQDFLNHHQPAAFSPPLVAYLLPDPFLPVNLSQLNPISEANIERVVFIGWLELVALVAFIWQFRHQTIGKLVGLASATLFVLSLGVSLAGTGLPLPYAVVSEVFPFSAVPETGRFMFFVQMLSVLCLGWWLQKLPSAKRLATTGGVLAILLFERFSWGQFYQLPPQPTAFLPAVQASSGAAVLDIPLHRQRVSAYPWYYQKAVLDGEAHWIGNTETSLSFLETHSLVDFKCDPTKKLVFETDDLPEMLQRNQELLTAFRQKQIKTLVVHADSTLYWPTCQNVLARARLLIPAYTVATETLASTEPTQVHWAGSALDGGLFFPRSGRFRINGFSLQPKLTAVELRLSDQPIYQPISSYFTEVETATSTVFELQPDQGQLLRVEAGETLSFNHPATVESGLLTIWYTYQPDIQSPRQTLMTEDLELLYSDNQAQVWQLR